MTTARNDLPLDAVSINGSYIEDIITGYTTVKAVGRETLEKALTITDNPSDGAFLKADRYPAREIEVSFVIQGTSMADMRSKMSTLGRILNVKDATIIFNGDSSCYCVGTPVMNTSATEYKNGIGGTFKINCLDPFFYSTSVTSVTLVTSGSVASKTFTYNGTYKCYPDLECIFPTEGEGSEYGYIGFTTARKDVIQLGNADEKDWNDIVNATKALVNNKFTAWNGWLHANASGKTISNRTQEGTASLDSGHVYASSYGSTDTAAAHGPTVYITPDWQGTGTGAQNFSMTVSQKFMHSNESEVGEFQALVVDSSNNLLGGVLISKSGKGKKCNITMYGDTKTKKYTVECSKVTSTEIRKEGGSITVKCAGKSNTFKPSGMESRLGNKLILFFGKLKDKTPVANNYVSKVIFEKFNCTYREDAENTFQSGYEVVANCREGRVYQNGEPNDSLGALGNDWETFCLVPGSNTITADWIGWKNGTNNPTAPTFKVTYRERYL